MTTANYEVVALRYATLPGRQRGENFVFTSTRDRELMPMDYFVWVVRNDERVILVDTGCTRAVAQKRGRDFLHAVPELLSTIGISATDIDTVVLTHLHYDHAGGLDWFPAAQFHLQRSELEFATGHAMSHPALSGPVEVEDVDRIRHLVDDGRVSLADGFVPLADGIELHRLGGHTGGLQVVRVRTARGWLVLASDALHYTENRTSGNPFPLVANVVEMLDGHRRCEELADSDELVIPGHDPHVREGSANGNSDVIALA
jgi:glyoxylase-like metal-dependent hydrolase (beta-lactamase superfamily II)